MVFQLTALSQRKPPLVYYLQFLHYENKDFMGIFYTQIYQLIRVLFHDPPWHETSTPYRRIPSVLLVKRSYVQYYSFLQLLLVFHYGIMEFRCVWSFYRSFPLYFTSSPLSFMLFILWCIRPNILWLGRRLLLAFPTYVMEVFFTFQSCWFGGFCIRVL